MGNNFDNEAQKKAHKKYEQSEKAKIRRKKYKDKKPQLGNPAQYCRVGICCLCGKEKPLVSKGRCDYCRKKKV